MAEGNKNKRFPAWEDIETIFNDEALDCGSDMEIFSDSENEENNDIYIQTASKHRNWKTTT